MEITQSFLTKNNCYIAGIKIQPKGIMVHSTACPGVPAINFVRAWNTAKPNNTSVCVHAFLDNKACYQTLPWNYKGWHAGGSANSSLIGFEICEPKDYNDKVYFETIKQRAIELCVKLCREYNLTADSITTHCEGYAKYGSTYASNHSDIHHWWKKYQNYSIDDFRNDVAKALKGEKKAMEFKTGKEALDYLVKNGRVSEPEYWEKVLETTKKVEYMFIKWAEDYSKITE